MNEGSRSGNLPVERSRGPFGCLILKKKGDEVSNGGSSSKERKKRKRLILSDSDPDQDSLPSSATKVISYDNDDSVVRYTNPDFFENEIGRKRKPAGVMYREDRRIDLNKFVESGIERKSRRENEKLDKILLAEGVEERRTEIGRNGVLISKTRLPIGKQREFRSDSSTSIQHGRSDHLEFDKRSSFSFEREKESVHMDRQRLEMKKHADIHPSMLRETSEFHHDKPIRVQGKNGVLKVLPSNKNKLGGPQKIFGFRKGEENTEISRSSDGKTPLSPPLYPKNELHERSQSVVVTDKKQVNSLKKLSIKHNKVHERRTQASGTPLPQQSQDVATCSSKSDANGKHKSLTSEPWVSDRQREEVKHGSHTDKKLLHEQISNKKQEVSNKKHKILTTEPCVSDRRTEVNCGSVPEKKSLWEQNGNKKPEVSNKILKTLTSEPCVSNRCTEEVKRGSGTEKQLIREQIRQMLVDAGWKIDLRPRRNRDYQDSVYVNPSGTEYWSITKAYYAFQKQFDNEGRDQKCSGDFSSFTPIPEDVLCKLTRKTRKKVERELKMEKKADKGSKDAKENNEKKLKNKHAKVKTDNSFSEENLHSYEKPDHKLLKVTFKGHNVVGVNADNLPKSKKSTMSKANYGNGENKKRGSLLARRSSKGMHMDDDDFVPYTGKRTILSWLIDMETVRLSGKVQYMNKKRTRTMLEGWITRDGIHCRCCSKILTISKFELHAGSKLHNPFQNIIVEDGLSLYQCQLDAWNKQDKSVRLGFHFIDVDDDPNDDTCGICGDGGELICCDGCPSTFHQNCLDIQMLPSGDWLCPNCSCKFCGGVDGSTGQENDTTLCSCSLCEEKYHCRCRQHADTTWIASDCLNSSFCGKACEELFLQLQKLIGVKHELEAGFSWSLIQCSNLESDTSSRGQYQKAECNSKIAVAFTVMDECFLPVIDHRSGVNLIHNVLFNIGSNFNRLNYSGFYTAVLERGDEVIAAASVRIHGTRLAEMPFIGTRQIYRRQGMCRRLLNAIESVLCSLNIEKLVIPAISELLHAWTTVFGFRPLEESHRGEMKTLNMLVFPSTDLLQKPLKHKLNEVNATESSVVKVIEPDENTDIGSVVPEICVPANGVVSDCKMSIGISIIETGPRSPGGSTLINNPSDASTIPDSFSGCSAPDIVSHCGVNHGKNLELGTNRMCNLSMEPKLQSSMEDDLREVNLEGADVERDMHSLDKTLVQHTARDNHEIKCDVASTGTNPHVHAGLKYDASYMLSKPLDTAFGSMSDGASEESTFDTKSIIHVVNHDSEYDVETKPTNGSLLESKLHNSVKNGSHEEKVEATNVELDRHPLNRTSLHHKRNADLSAIVDRNAVQNKPDMKEHNVPKVEENDKVSYEHDICSSENNIVNEPKVNNEDASTEISSDGLNGSIHDSSDVTGSSSVVALRLVPDTLSDESTPEPKVFLPCMNYGTTLDVEAKSSVKLKPQHCAENDVPELEAETCNGEHTNKNSNYLNAIIGHSVQSTGGNCVEKVMDLNSHGVHKVGCTSVEVRDVASGTISHEDNFQGCNENFECHDSKDTSQPLNRNSDKNNWDIGGPLLNQHDFQPLQNVQNSSYGVTGAMIGFCKFGSGIALDDHNPQELVEDLVECTSEVNGV